jgi:hypothetical protein
LDGSEHLWRVKFGARTAMEASGSVHARGEARADFIDRALACDDRMTAKMPSWYGGASAGARDRGRTGDPHGARVRRGHRATRGVGVKSRCIEVRRLGKRVGTRSACGLWGGGGADDALADTNSH